MPASGVPGPRFAPLLRSPAGRLLGLCLLGAVYFAAGKLGLALAYVNASASAVWPPTGIALAALLLFGYRAWPAIAVGAFLVNLTTTWTVATSAAIGAGNTLEALVAALLVNRFAGGWDVFKRPKDILRFVLLAAVAATALGATIGVTTLSVAGLSAWGQYGQTWLTWWLGDAAGALVVAPLLLLWAREPRPRWDRWTAGEAGLLFGVVVALAMVVYGRPAPPVPAIICVPFPLWAAFRLGRREAVTATVLISAVAIWGTLHGYGPFARASQNESLLVLQTYMAVLSTITLTTAAVAAQRDLVERALRAAS